MSHAAVPRELSNSDAMRRASFQRFILRRPDEVRGRDSIVFDIIYICDQLGVRISAVHMSLLLTLSLARLLFGTACRCRRPHASLLPGHSGERGVPSPDHWPEVELLFDATWEQP